MLVGWACSNCPVQRRFDEQRNQMFWKKVQDTAGKSGILPSTSGAQDRNSHRHTHTHNIQVACGMLRVSACHCPTTPLERLLVYLSTGKNRSLDRHTEAAPCIATFDETGYWNEEKVFKGKKSEFSPLISHCRLYEQEHKTQ